uniref:Phospholipase A2 domain-containing protein n=1 Tax=Panagrellus redivivus TaxID=6233 RepID=A0A7E4VC37_PANRE
MLRLGVLVILVNVAITPVFGQLPKFHCGRNDVENMFASLSVTLNCQPKLAHFNNCCLAHDTCYDNQLGQNNCDNAFCACLNTAAAGNPFCKGQADLFCNLVRQNGAMSYGEAGRRRG